MVVMMVLLTMMVVMVIAMVRVIMLMRTMMMVVMMMLLLWTIEGQIPRFLQKSEQILISTYVESNGHGRHPELKNENMDYWTIMKEYHDLAIRRHWSWSRTQGTTWDAYCRSQASSLVLFMP